MVSFVTKEMSWQRSGGCVPFKMPNAAPRSGVALLCSLRLSVVEPRDFLNLIFINCSNYREKNKIPKPQLMSSRGIGGALSCAYISPTRSQGPAGQAGMRRSGGRPQSGSSNRDAAAARGAAPRPQRRLAVTVTSESLARRRDSAAESPLPSLRCSTSRPGPGPRDCKRVYYRSNTE